jgi:hypothetical protein
VVGVGATVSVVAVASVVVGCSARVDVVAVVAGAVEGTGEGCGEEHAAITTVRARA